MILTLIVTGVIVLLALGVIAVVAFGSSETLAERSPELGEAATIATRHLNGDAEPPGLLVGIFEEFPEVSTAVTVVAPPDGGTDPTLAPGRS